LRRAEAFGRVLAAFDGLVHATARVDPVTRDRHRAFIAAHLVGGLLAVAALPALVALRGQPGLPDGLALAWLAAPVLAAIHLSRTGRFGESHLIAAVAFTGLVAHVAWWTGGLNSFVAAWLVVVPFEAALSGSRRVVLGAVAAAAAAILGLAGAAFFGLLPPPSGVSIGQAALFVGAASAAIYAGGVAISLDRAGRRAEDDHRREDARYRLLAENATDLISRHTRSGLVLLASPAARALVGAPPESLYGDGLFNRVHVADRPAFLQAFAEAAASGAPATVEVRLRTDEPAGGGFRWVEMRCRRADPGPDGAVELVAVTRDVEARRRQSDELAAANLRSEEANAAKTRFLANMSHELRTPLNAIIGFSELMAHDTFDCRRERVVEYAQLVNDSGRHLLDVVNGILDMSKIDAGSFEIVAEPFDARDLVRNVVSLMQPAADKTGVELRIELPANAPELSADRRACKQMLLNLLSNAVKFTDRGGTVTTSLAFGGGFAEFTVSDTGIGIAEEDLPKLATPFVQAQASYDRHYEGTGLGLSVVKGLAELHGGELAIRSTLGVGTAATVRLPLSAAPAADVTPFPARAPEAAAAPQPMRKRHG
jgi:cell cycle sensor histidine kinase DivJ